MSAIYVYYYKSDSSCEPIGRVSAIDINDATEQIAVLKQLSSELIQELFVVVQIKGGKNETNI
jgi:hypothetical protein